MVSVLETQEDNQPNSKVLHWLKANVFLLLTLAGICAGFVIGLTIRTAKPSSDTLMWIGMPGEVYMRILNVMVLPLTVCTVIDGTANTSTQANGKICIITLTYIMVTNFLGATVGVVLAFLVSPGFIPDLDPGPGLSEIATENRHLLTVDIFADFIRNLFPNNFVRAALEMAQTKYSKKQAFIKSNVSGMVAHNGTTVLTKHLSAEPVTNVIGLMIVSAAMGVAASSMGEKCRPFTLFFNACAIIIFKLFDWIKWTTPVGVASLIAQAMANIHNIESALNSMGMFVLAITVGSLAYQFIILPVIFFIFIRENPFRFTYNISKCCLVSFGSSTTVLTAMSSLAIPAVPSASIVVLLIILGSVGIPTSCLGLIMAVEWLNDRVRTTVNVTSHIVGVLVTWRLCKTSLLRQDMKDMKKLIQEMEVP